MKALKLTPVCNTWWFSGQHTHSIHLVRNLGSTPSWVHTTGWVVRDRVRPINTMKGKAMDWGEEVDKEVMELRKQLMERMVNMRKVRTAWSWWSTRMTWWTSTEGTRTVMRSWGSTGTAARRRSAMPTGSWQGSGTLTCSGRRR